MIRGAGNRWLVAALAVSAALTSGCTVAPPDADGLPGVYRSDETGGEILLDSDGTFTATDISADEATGGGGTDLLDFSGQWEFVASEGSRDFVYLETKDGGLGKIGDIQLYVSERVTVAGIQLSPGGRPEVEIQPDPDGPPSLVLTKAATP